MENQEFCAQMEVLAARGACNNINSFCADVLEVIYRHATSARLVKTYQNIGIADVAFYDANGIFLTNHQVSTDNDKQFLLFLYSTILFGAGWQAQAARLLDVDARTIRRWIRGQFEIKDSIIVELSDKVREQQASRQELLNVFF